jgi:hypothetical protein
MDESVWLQRMKASLVRCVRPCHTIGDGEQAGRGVDIVVEVEASGDEWRWATQFKL